jgi:hypothetical protein
LSFPIQVSSRIYVANTYLDRVITLYRGLTLILGPNGSGKTHLLRGLRQSLSSYLDGKKIRFLSAGRMGALEPFRSDFDGNRGGNPRYDETHYGRKSDQARRHENETILGDIQTLAARPDILIKIQERLRKLFQRELTIIWDGGYLRVEFAHLEGATEPYSSGREASGLLHLVGILSALYDDDVGALLIDEPEVSLHPQLQAFLLGEVIAVAGRPAVGSNKKLIVMATHSTEMVEIESPQDLASIVFCYDLAKEPVQIAPTVAELKNKRIQELIARLGQEHKLALFSKRPLLVEGPSDVMICGALARKTNNHLEAAGSQLLPVIGKGQMAIVAKLFRLLGKQPVLLVDADGIADGLDLATSVLANNKDADRLASEHGAGSAIELAGNIYRDFCAVVDKHWPEISPYAEMHAYWINRKDDETKARRRSAFCALIGNDEFLLSNPDRGGQWRATKTRLSVLLSLLGSQGCFVLKRGTVESYYQKSDRITSIGKPAAALDEVNYIRQLDETQLGPYEDILECITFAASIEKISESAALRDILSAAVAPAIAKLKVGASTRDIEILARSLLGDRAKLFKFEVTSSGMTVDIESAILNVDAFPISIGSEEDVIKSVNASLGIK